MACPPYRASRRDVRVDDALPRALRWYWEVFGASALSLGYVAPDDPAERDTALGILAEWAQRDARYEALALEVTRAHVLVAFDDDELVLAPRGPHDDPPLVALRAPDEAAEAPGLVAYAPSALRFLVGGALKGVWSELVRVLLTARPPLEFEAPFPRVAPHVGRAAIEGAPVWMAERVVRERPGFALYFRPQDAESVEAWLVAQGLADDMLV